MSRWRRQQRKRARLARSDWALDQSIDQQLRAIRESLLSSLTAPLSAPRDVSKHVDRFLAQMCPLPRTKTTVTSKLHEGERRLSVDIYVENPSPPLAAALLAAGGRWVDPPFVKELDFGFTFKPNEDA